MGEPAMFELGALTVVRAEQELLDWMRSAETGARFVYAVGRVTPRGHPTFKLAGTLGQSRHLRPLTQRRETDGQTEWIVERLPRPIEQPAVIVAGDEDDDAVLRAIRRRINFKRPMATNAELAKECGLRDASRASYVLRRLANRQLIRVVEPGPGLRRVVTIVATNERTIEGAL
jgi:hypothetical protein